ncbi:Flp family type IVb pilin [Bradyrhizobium sp. CCGUVB23]|uniref:Flp family type IVb pilin n=1 Tax=Bradyrhizobium sp. CCGUVB23 TaxID=2949630 RepID=UPI0020B3868B|nr:hypothetical protein [Bradyrhizobium sp. CCGUVB23]MCP3459212.1 hypothetical protein [Bradyrhizobium sp. CCGUVB23]
MLKTYIKSTEALKQFRADTRGVVSFEYVIVAACVVGAVIFAFGPTGSGALGTALQGAINTIIAKVNAALA